MLLCIYLYIWTGLYFPNKMEQDMRVINDPLDQTHSPPEVIIILA